MAKVPTVIASNQIPEGTFGSPTKKKTTVQSAAQGKFPSIGKSRQKMMMMQEARRMAGKGVR